MVNRIVIITGSGISSSSGIPTFRDNSGSIWSNFNIKKYGTYSGYKSNKEEFLVFYNKFREKVINSYPSKSHLDLSKLESRFDVSIITQNLDDLHERAGSSKVIHTHGNILKSRSTLRPELVYDHLTDIDVGMKCTEGSQLIHDVVLFGDSVRNFNECIGLIKSADLIIVIGTSLSVYPMNELIKMKSNNCISYYIDKDPNMDFNNLFDFIYKGDSDVETNRLVNSLLS